jgi:anti-sigma B factor antagonist
MNVEMEIVDGVALVKLPVELDSSVAPVVLQQALLPLAKAGGNIILDMTEVEYISSAGLRMLMSIYRHVSSRGGRVVLIGVADEIQDMLELMGLSRYLLLCKTLLEGMEALAPRGDASS